MDERDNLELDLEHIIKEFSDAPQEEDTEEEVLTQFQPEESEPQPEEVTQDTHDEIPERTESVTSDTIRLDTIRLDTTQFAKGKVHNAAPIDEDAEEKSEPFSDQWEPEYEQPMGEYAPTQQIIFHPRSRLRELKRQLVAGPEKRYYALMEKGLGKLQAAIFLSLLTVLACAITTVMFSLGMVQENRLRLMVFGQFLAMLISALLGSFQLIEGASDLLHKRFTLNTLLVFSFVISIVDAIFCLQQLRIPCCAGFSLAMLMSLWNTYQRRVVEMGQMDTMRKATHLDTVQCKSDYLDGTKGFLRGEGQVADFMEHYQGISNPERIQNRYALIALILSICIGILSGVLNGIASGIQVAAVSLLVSIPVGMFITTSRPMAVLERRLNAIGTVLCGWDGVEGMCGDALFPVESEDLFPSGTVRINGVKFFGNREPDEIIAYGTALITADGGSLTELFTQVLESRNGHFLDAQSYTAYDGGIGGDVEGEAVLVGSLSFLKDMGVELPEGIRVSGAVCVAIEQELCGIFAVSYDRNESSAAGLRTLCGYRKLSPIMTSNDFMMTDRFIRSKLGVNTKRMVFPTPQQKDMLSEQTPEQEDKVLALITGEGLLPFAYSVTGARALRSAAKTGMVVSIVGGALGLAMMLALTLLGALYLLTPANMFLYQLVWLIPGLLITEWTRSI